MGAQERYTSKTYQEHVPDWHVSESAWKARHILKMLEKHRLAPQTICEIGCGAGEVLRVLEQRLPTECQFIGYDISPTAMELAATRANERLRFVQGDLTKALDEALQSFDLVLVLDVVEHLEDYFSFLRALQPLGKRTIFHFPLDLSAQTIIRPNGLLNTRQAYGHLHYFTKEIILKLLDETGYTVLDWAYTPESLEQPTHELRRNLVRLPRRILYSLNHDLAARMLGGFRFIVLAR